MKKYIREVIFDLKPKHGYRLEVVTLEPSGALSVHVSSEDHIRVMGVTLTHEEAVDLARALAVWVVSK